MRPGDADTVLTGLERSGRLPGGGRSWGEDGLSRGNLCGQRLGARGGWMNAGVGARSFCEGHGWFLKLGLACRGARWTVVEKRAQGQFSRCKMGRCYRVRSHSGAPFGPVSTLPARLCRGRGDEARQEDGMSLTGKESGSPMVRHSENLICILWELLGVPWPCRP